jgi:hypothetical protein
MIHRRHINRITHLENDRGQLIREHTHIEEELNHYYQTLLTESKVDISEAIARVTSHIPKLITPEQNTALTRPISKEEADQAIKDMPPGKSQGPDGFTTNFFHHCWDIIGNDV